MKKIVFLINLLCVAGVVASEKQSFKVDGVACQAYGSTVASVLDSYLHQDKNLPPLPVASSASFTNVTFEAPLPLSKSDGLAVTSLLVGRCSFGRGLAYHGFSLYAAEVKSADGKIHKDVEINELM